MSLFQEFTTEESVTAVFLGLLGRPPKQGALDHYSAAIDDPGNGYGIAEMLSELVNSQPEWEERTDSMTRAQLVEYLFNNLFDRDPHFDEEGKNYWVDGEGASVPADQMVTQLIESAGAQDQIALANKVDAALSDPGTDFTLTNKADNLSGTDLDDVFDAPLVQNDLGGVTNSLASGDRIDGGAGTDELWARLISEDTQVGGQSTVIEPETTSVENFFFQAQGQSVPLISELEIQQDNFVEVFFGEDGELIQTNIVDLSDLAQSLNVGGPITIDAGSMNGVEELWSHDSRTDLQIEDVRSNPNNTTIGMSGTDHNVSYFVKFDADVIAGNLGDSAVTYEFANLLEPGDELAIADSPAAGGWVESLEFTLDGESFVLNGADVAAATTFAELEAAVEAALIDLGLVDLQVSLDTSFINPVNGQPGAQLLIFDPDGGIFTNPQTNINDGATTGALFFDADVGAPQEQDPETNIILDNVGRNDVGGILDVGGMSNKGIKVFNVEVDEKSWLTSLQSTSVSVDPSTDSFHHLEVVNVTHLSGGAMGDLAIGSQSSPANTDGDWTTMPTGGRVNTDGLTDVRVFNAAGFSGAINLGARFTDDIFARYLDDAEEPVQFNYIGGEGGNLFTLRFVAGSSVGFDPDFKLNVVGGASDDRFNILGPYSWSNVSVDGGLGFDTLEVGSSIGSPAGFNSIEKLVLAGANTVNANMTVLPGVQELWIATGDPDTTVGEDSTITGLAADTTVFISGKKQTLGNANSNNDQHFGDITFNGAQAESLLITLDNTARLNGELSVDSLTISGGNVNELVLDSSGRRNTTNTVDNISAAGVTSLVFIGTQSLNAEVDVLASGGQAFDITGEDLEGDLFLDIEQAIITASNNNNNEVTLTGTDGSNDYLVLDGGGVANITSDTTITEFETVEFDNFAGSVNAINFSGVDRYYVQDLDGVTTITNLKNGDNVDIGDGQGDTFDLTLAGTGSGAINIRLFNDDSGALNWGTNDLNVSGFNTVNLALDNSSSSNETTNLSLILDNATGIDLDDPAVNPVGDAAFFATDGGALDDAYVVDQIVSNLVITGGNAGNTDSLTLTEPLPASLSTIDASGFTGTFTATLFNTVVEDPGTPGDYLSANTDTKFVLSGSTFADITLTPWDPAGGALMNPQESGVDFNTIFQFTSAGNVTWEINEFVYEDADGSGNSNYSILDLRQLGIESFADLDFTAGDVYTAGTATANNGNNYLSTDVVITSEVNPSWEIVLVGVTEADLAPSENFMFA